MKILCSIPKYFVVSLLLTSGAAFFGCSSSSQPSTPAGSSIVIPKAGSTYTYSRHERDSTIGKKPTTTDSVVVATVISSGMPFEGKNNVITIDDDFDTLRYVFESSNDITIYRASLGSNGFVFFNPTPWITLPFGSKMTGVQVISFDTSVSAQGATIPVHISGVADYIGVDSIVKGSSKYASGSQVKLTVTITGSIFGTPIVITASQSYSFDISKGGYFHSVTETQIPNVVILKTQILQGNTSLVEKILTDFTLLK